MNCTICQGEITVMGYEQEHFGGTVVDYGNRLTVKLECHSCYLEYEISTTKTSTAKIIMEAVKPSIEAREERRRRAAP